VFVPYVGVYFREGLADVARKDLVRYGLLRRLAQHGVY
jgi:hypothetical protein